MSRSPAGSSTCCKSNTTSSPGIPAILYCPCGSLCDAEAQKLGTVNMRTAISVIIRKRIRLVNPENTFRCNAALHERDS